MITPDIVFTIIIDAALAAISLLVIGRGAWCEPGGFVAAIQ